MSEIRVIVTSDTPPSRCQLCFSEFNCATNIDGVPHPQPGDLTVCINCGALMIYKPDYRLRLATDEEIATMTDHARETLRLYQEFVRRERRKRKNAAESGN